MKAYEIRTKDLAKVNHQPLHPILAFALIEYEQFLKDTTSVPDFVLVEHEFETDAEANEARMLWLEETHQRDNWVEFVKNAKAHGSATKYIDKARNAPKPKITVIATPEGEK